MENISKYVGYVLLAVSVTIFSILTMTGNHVELVPIDQSLCPPDVSTAVDGTCGIYEGKKVSNGFIAAVIIGVVGFIAMAYSFFLSKKSA